MMIYDAQGKKINLADRHFLAEGGEGKLFAYKGKVYKIYLDPAKMLLTAKMDELALLDSPSIVRPLESIYNRMSDRVGFSMLEVPHAIPLPRLFTSSFWRNNGITPMKIADLVKAMQKTIAFVHSKGFLQVDGNEFNYMTNPTFSQPYFIDVDSYQTPSFPATAIMPSIRDYTQAEFNQGTDWFAFAIVAFQLFAGIHPFKGRHPDFNKGDFAGRVKAGASVLNKAVAFPSSVRDFSLIPKNYLEWFERLFEGGERLDPPTGKLLIAPRIKNRVIRETAQVAVKCIGAYPDEIGRFNVINGQYVIYAGKKLYVGKRPYDIPPGAKGVFMRDNGDPAFVVIENGLLGLMDATNGHISLSGMEAEYVFIAGNVPYIIRDTDLIEISIMDLEDRFVIAPGPVRKILPDATTVFQQVLFENVLGKAHLMIPERAGEMPIVRIQELDALRVVDGRYERGVAVFIVADKQGDYKQVRLRFSTDFTHYDAEVREDIEDPLNFTVLDKGLLVSIPRDGLLEVVVSKPGSDAVREVVDPQVGAFMRLYNDGGRVVASSDKEIYKLSLNS